MSQTNDDPLSRPEKLLTLLSFAPEQSPWSPDELGAILAHQLDAPLADTVSEASRGGHRTLRALLADASPPIQCLEHVKRFAKEASVNAESGLPKEVATVLYLATIVAARHCGTSLTKLDDATLRERVAWALQREWLSDDLRQLFQRCID